MFDRVLDTTHELGKKGYDKKLAERVVLLYRDSGIESAITYLTTESKFSKEKAIALVTEIDKIYIRDNRQILIFYAAIVFVLIFLVYLGAISSFYFLLVLSGLYLVRRSIILFQFTRKNRFKRHLLK